MLISVFKFLLMAFKNLLHICLSVRRSCCYKNINFILCYLFTWDLSAAPEVLTRVRAVLKSPWIFFNCECSGLERPLRSKLMLFGCPRQNINQSAENLKVIYTKSSMFYSVINYQLKWTENCREVGKGKSSSLKFY